MRVCLSKSGHRPSIFYEVAKTVKEAFELIDLNKDSDDPVTELSIPNNPIGLELLGLLDGEYGLLQVVVQDADVSSDINRLIAKNRWNKPVLSKNAANVIMVLKGNHDLGYDISFSPIAEA